MFDILKILSFIALIDYIIYNYYKKHYNTYLNLDIYKYRLIACYLFWFFISFLLFYKIVELNINTYLIIIITTFLFYLLMNIYTKYCYDSYSYEFICVDIIYGLLLIHIIMLIIYFHL